MRSKNDSDTGAGEIGDTLDTILARIQRLRGR
jgi:hypothetical protein